MKRKILLGCAVIVFMLIVLPRLSGAFYLLDDKLRVKGSVYEFMIYGTDLDKRTSEYRTTNLGLVKTKGTLELLLKAYECQDSIVNLFGFFQYYRESVPDLDDKYRRSIHAPARRRFQGPYEDQDDWINELYADVYKGPWNLRFGKQIVFWSEVELVRTIDQINQLDLRYSSPGIDPWDEIKLGLWMIRGFYNSQLPGQLVFEGILIPGDFEQVRIPVEGTFWGSPPAPPYDLKEQPVPYGQNAAIADMFRRSKPAMSLKNSMVALRIRGNSEISVLKTPYLLDWTVSWFHGMNNTPIPRNQYLGEPSVLNLNPNTINGYLNNVAFSRVGGRSIPRLTHTKWWRYKFYDIIGASCQTYIPAIKGVMRGEIAYELGLPEMTADSALAGEAYAKPITGTTERDVLNVGFTYDRPIRWNWLQNQQWLGANGVLDTSFGWFEQYRLGDVHEIRRTFGYKQRSQTGFTITTRTSLRNNELTPVFRMLWNTRKWGYIVCALRYTPGAHYRYEIGYQFFHARNVWDAREAQAKHKDSLYLRIGYEF
jgi:hypothetical protein